MTIAIDFYLIAEKTVTEAGSFICRLSNKIYKEGHWLYINVNSATETNYLNDLLWTFADTSFLPHSTIVEKPAPIQIGQLPTKIEYPEILINLTPTIPDDHERFQRILEIIPADANLKAAGREKYKFYQQNQYELKLHEIS